MLRCSANPALERPRFCLVIKVVAKSTGEGPGLCGDHSDKAIAVEGVGRLRLINWAYAGPSISTRAWS